MAHDIFISYSSKDKQTADAICHVLEANKLKCWIAPRNIISGQNYAEQIMDGLKNTKIVVLVFSKNSQESVFVNNEIDTAFSNNKPIISFKIDETLPEDKMGFFLKNKHWLDAYPNPEKVFETLVHDAYLLCEQKQEDEYVEHIIVQEVNVDDNEISELEEKLTNNMGHVVDVVELDEDSNEDSDEDLVEDTVDDGVDEEVEDDDKNSELKFDTPQVANSNKSNSSSKLKLPIIAIIIVLVAIVGVFIAMGGMGGNNSGGTLDGIQIDYIDIADDGESYYIYGSIDSKLNNSSNSVIHTDFYDGSGKVVKSNDLKLKDFDGTELAACLVGDEKVEKVSVELRDSDGKAISKAESNNII